MLVRYLKIEVEGEQMRLDENERLLSGLPCRETYRTLSTLEKTQGQIDGFFSQLPCKCHQNQVAFVGD